VTDWQTRALGEICHVAPGPSGAYQGDVAKISGDGIPMIMQIGADNTIEPRSVRMVAARHEDDLARFRLAVGDILCVRQGSLGRFTMIGADQAGWVYGSACIRIRVERSDLVMPAYLLSYLMHPPVRDALIARANPGTVATIRAADVADLPVALPPVRCQTAIAGATQAIDDQVEASRRLIDKLQSQRSALMTEFIGENLPVEAGAGTALVGEAANVPVGRRSGRMS